MKKMLGALMLAMALVTAGVLPAAAHHWLDIRQAGLAGPVRSMTEVQLLPEGEGWTEIPLRRVVYNTDGHAIKVRTYKGMQAFEDKGYEYDRQGRMTLSGLYVADGSFEPQEVHSYNAAGELAESRYLAADGTPFLIKQYRYEQGRLQKEEHLSGDGGTILVKQYEYDAAGAKTGIVTLGRDGSFLSREKISAGGQESECEYEGELAGYGRRIRIQTLAEGHADEVCYLPDGSVYQNQVCDTPENDGMKRTVRRADGSIASETFYNAAGDSVARRLYAPDGTMTEQEKLFYRYDAQGNWTERRVIRYDSKRADWQEMGKTVREIVYF